MKAKKNILFLLLALGLSTTSSYGVFNAIFSTFGGGNQTALSNGGGATNGMMLVAVIDTAGDGFSNNYTNFNPCGGGGFLGVNCGPASDDYYFNVGACTLTFAGTVGSASTLVLPDNGTDLDGAGAYTAGAHNFALMWLPTSTANAADTYGIIANAGVWTLQNSGFNFQATGFRGVVSAPGGVFTPVPEPSTYALIIGASALGLVYWRKRRHAVSVEQEDELTA